MLNKTIIFLLVVSSGITLIIEIYNSKAGYVLPKKNEGNGKWRILGAAEEVFIKRYKIDNGINLDQNLTEEQLNEIKPKVDRAKAESKLRSIVGSWGLLQYPLSILIIILSLVQLKRQEDKAKTMFITSIGIAVITFGFAFQRSYFSSLGW